jgi:hypothetical protein
LAAERDRCQEVRSCAGGPTRPADDCLKPRPAGRYWPRPAATRTSSRSLVCRVHSPNPCSTSELTPPTRRTFYSSAVWWTTTSSPLVQQDRRTVGESFLVVLHGCNSKNASVMQITSNYAPRSLPMQRSNLSKVPGQGRPSWWWRCAGVSSAGSRQPRRRTSGARAQAVFGVGAGRSGRSREGPRRGTAPRRLRAPRPATSAAGHLRAPRIAVRAGGSRAIE